MNLSLVARWRVSRQACVALVVLNVCSTLLHLYPEERKCQKYVRVPERSKGGGRLQRKHIDFCAPHMRKLNEKDSSFHKVSLSLLGKIDIPIRQVQSESTQYCTNLYTHYNLRNNTGENLISRTGQLPCYCAVLAARPMVLLRPSSPTLSLIMHTETHSRLRTHARPTHQNVHLHETWAAQK